MTMAENLYEITSGLACGQAGAAKAMSSVIGHFTDASVHVTEAEKADWGGRLDAPPGGAPGQVLTASGSGAVWADAKGRKPSLFTLEEKSVRAGEPYEADLNGRQIQKYSLGSAASGVIEIAVKGLADIPHRGRAGGRAPDPGAAWGGGERGRAPAGRAGGPACRPPLRAAREVHGLSVYRYHDVMVKAGRRVDGAPFAHVRHEYAFDESVSLESMRDYFCIEPVEDGSTIACENFSPSYGLSSSLDGAVWTALTGGVIASNVQAGAKVYLRGDTSTLGSVSGGPGCRFYSDKAFKASGKALSLYSPSLEPKELTNEYDLKSFFNSKKICECSVDFGPVRNANSIFYQCAYLSALPEGFSAPNVTNTSCMFWRCSRLSGLPAGFSCPNVTEAEDMFYNCARLSGLPDSFSIPNVTDAYGMFNGCSSLTALPAGFSCPNVTNAVEMFYNCSRLSGLPAGFSIPNVTGATSMFDGCSSLFSLPDGFSAMNVASAFRMFYGCSSLSSLPDGFSAQSVTNAGNMFSGCSSLSGLHEGFSVPNATNAYRMFYDCSSLSGLPDGFRASNVTYTTSMFQGCSSLSAIGYNVKIADGAGATSLDETGMDKSLITSIGVDFEWFTNAKFSGTWDPALGIRNVFPNATSVGSGWRVYNHYDGEESAAPSGLDYFCIEPMTDGATITCENFSSSYKLSSSLDKETWTALTGGTVAAGVPAGAKVYLRGDTGTLGSTDTHRSCRFYSDKAFKAGGRVLSLYSPTLEQKELMNKYDLRSFFYDKEIRECSVDFGPVRSATLMFSYCSSLSALPEGFSIPNVTSTVFMFSDCSSLSALPDDFSIPNVTDATAMFLYCSSLSALPDGFNIPNVTKASRMFERCSRLSGLPDGFSTPNATVTNSMFEHCSRLSGLPDGFSVPNTTDTDRMFYECSRLSVIGHNVKIANGAGATDTDNTSMDKSLITSIGDSFEWFTNAKFEGDWDPSKGIRNVFPNATSVGPGWRVYNHYDGEASGEAPSDLDYFYIEPTEDNATVTCENLDQSYNLSYSLDKSSWTALTGGTVATGVPAGTKVYLRGDTSTLGSAPGGSGCKFYSDGAFKAGGSALSLYSPTLEPKELTNEYDLMKSFFYNKEIRECSVDFGPVRNANNMFAYCSNLSALPEGFSASNVTDAYMMFFDCSSLSALPAGFSAQNVVCAYDMFWRCSRLSGLPDGFSAPNVTDAEAMFADCYSLTTIGSNVKIANGAGATSTDNTSMDKSLITSIGDSFEWFTNAKFEGDWDPSKGIRNVFPNANSVGPGWKVYNHYDGE